MNITLIRDILSPDSTMGKLSAGELSMFTCEDTLRGNGNPLTVAEWKRPGITCIPYGTYKVIINFSNRFQKPLPLLLGVPGFTGVRIHGGNTPADSSGCILIGTGRANGQVINSRLAMNAFMPMLESALTQGDVWITIQ